MTSTHCASVQCWIQLESHVLFPIEICSFFFRFLAIALVSRARAARNGSTVPVDGRSLVALAWQVEDDDEVCTRTQWRNKHVHLNDDTRPGRPA